MRIIRVCQEVPVTVYAKKICNNLFVSHTPSAPWVFVKCPEIAILNNLTDISQLYAFRPDNTSYFNRKEYNSNNR